MNVTSEIKSYIELKETCGALLLTGKWGCGKSYIMHQLADSLNGEDQYAVAIVSLFGVQSIEELDKKVKEAQKALIMRIIYGVAIFFLVMVIQVIFGLVGEGADTTNMCFKCVSLGGC